MFNILILVLVISVLALVYASYVFVFKGNHHYPYSSYQEELMRLENKEDV